MCVAVFVAVCVAERLQCAVCVYQCVHKNVCISLRCADCNLFWINICLKKKCAYINTMVLICAREMTHCNTEDRTRYNILWHCKFGGVNSRMRRERNTRKTKTWVVGTLQHTATRYNTMQHIAETHVVHRTYIYMQYCNTLSETFIELSRTLSTCACTNILYTLQHTAKYRNTLHHSATHCKWSQHTATHRSYMLWRRMRRS